MVHFCCFRPIYPEEELDEENIIEDDAELDLNTMPDTKDEVCRIVNELIADIMLNPSHCQITPMVSMAILVAHVILLTLAKFLPDAIGCGLYAIFHM